MTKFGQIMLLTGSTGILAGNAAHDLGAHVEASFDVGATIFLAIFAICYSLIKSN